jgi:hypothetical protein
MNILIKQYYNRSLLQNSIKHFTSIYTQNKKEEKKIDPKILAERKKIFNKRTYHRHISLERKYFPTDDIEEQDRRELVDYHKTIVFDKQYLNIMNDWQLNLERNRVKKAKTKQKFEEYVKQFNLG